jgi:hypothetical protein
VWSGLILLWEQQRSLRTRYGAFTQITDALMMTDNSFSILKQSSWLNASRCPCPHSRRENSGSANLENHRLTVCSSYPFLERWIHPFLGSIKQKKNGESLGSVSTSSVPLHVSVLLQSDLPLVTSPYLFFSSGNSQRPSSTVAMDEIHLGCRPSAEQSSPRTLTNLQLDLVEGGPPSSRSFNKESLLALIPFDCSEVSSWIAVFFDQ